MAQAIPAGYVRHRAYYCAACGSESGHNDEPSPLFLPENRDGREIFHDCNQWWCDNCGVNGRASFGCE